MNMITFLKDLLQKGQVTLPPKMKRLPSHPSEEINTLIIKYARDDRLDMPLEMPNVDVDVAYGAAKYLYYAMQLVLLRDQDVKAINKYLVFQHNEPSPSVIYSVDLFFRYLPKVIKMAIGMAPDDPLVVTLNATARKWPFSNPQVPIAEMDNKALDIILEKEALRIAFLDRIVKTPNKKDPKLEPYLLQYLGKV